MQLPYGQVWQRIRPAPRDRTGDRTGADSVPLVIPRCAYAVDSVVEDVERRETTVETGTLFVPRGTDVVSTDKLVAPSGRRYDATSDLQWDMAHPMTGRDFGYAAVRVRAVV